MFPRSITFIQGERKGAFPFSNSLLVRGRKNVLIDCGVGLKVALRLKGKVDVVVNSHLHVDHFSCNWVFKGKEIIVPSPELGRTNLEALAKRYVSSNLTDKWLRFAREATGVRDFKPTSGYDEGPLKVSESEIEAIYTPGHTKWHYVFLIDGETLYGADIDLTSFGPWYGHEESSIEEFIRSIEKIKEIEPKTYVSSHREPIFGREKILDELDKYERKIEETGKKILSLLSKPTTIEKLVKQSPIYGRKPFANDLLDYFEATMIKHQIKRLMKKRLVKEVNKGLYSQISNKTHTLQD